MAGKYYVYVWFRRNGVPCYVGKGHGNRWRRHGTRSRNPHLAAIIRAAEAELPVVIVQDGMTEQAAFELERVLIATIGREANGGPLVNFTDGGDGVSGLRHTDLTKALVGAKSRNMWSDPDQRAKTIAAQNAGKSTPEFSEKRSAASILIWADLDRRARMSAIRTLHYLSEENREAIGAATKAGMADEQVRVRLSSTQKTRYDRDPSHLQRLNEWHTGRKQSPETIQKRADSLTGGKRSSESRAKMSAWQIGRKMSADAKAKMSAAAKRRRNKETI